MTNEDADGLEPRPASGALAEMQLRVARDIYFFERFQA